MSFVLIQDSNVQPLEDQEMCAICQEIFNEMPTQTAETTDASGALGATETTDST